MNIRRFNLMSFISNKAYITSKINSLKLRINSEESAEADFGADKWVTTIVKLAVIFIIGIFIIQGVVENTGLNNSSEPFYSLLQSVQSNITSGYTLASLMILVVGAGAIIHYLGFV